MPKTKKPAKPIKVAGKKRGTPEPPSKPQKSDKRGKSVGKAMGKAAGKATKKTSLEPPNKKRKLAEEPKATPKIEKLIKKGRAAVDKMVPGGNKLHVYESNGKVYHSSLMWSDLKHNNNKFYIIQILQDDSHANAFTVFNRWGRVGVDGQHASFRHNSPSAAIAQYEKKYRDKVGKGYTEIHIDFEDDAEAEEPVKTKGKGKGPQPTSNWVNI